MKNNKNIITRKIKYTTDENSSSIIKSYIKNYNNVLRFTFNRLQENPSISTKEMSALHRELNNVFIGTHLCGSAIYDAKTLFEKHKNNKVIFGGKKLFIQKCQNKITKEEWQEKRLFPLCSIGQAPNKCNRMFQIIDSTHILFKPTRVKHIVLSLPKQSKKTIKELEYLIQLQEDKAIPITYKLDSQYIYITYDYSTMKQFYKPTNKIENRILAVDLNPNYIGYSVIDWQDKNSYKIIDKGVVSIKPINDKEINLSVSSTDKKKQYLHNKRKYELQIVAQKLCKLANHYQCNLFGIEDLSIKSSDKGKGKTFNALCNNYWNKNIVVKQIRKYCQVYNIEYQPVMANYSSFIGNLVYRNEKLPDMVLASIEISRRTYEFHHQYIKKDKEIKKNIIFPELERVKNVIIQSLEELSITVPFETLRELYYQIKKSKQRYRLSLEDTMFFSKFYSKQKIILYSFV